MREGWQLSSTEFLIDWLNSGIGDKFATGDVLLEIETDKAQMDVEAQDEGIMAKIIVRFASLVVLGIADIRIAC